MRSTLRDIAEGNVEDGSASAADTTMLADSDVIDAIRVGALADALD